MYKRFTILTVTILTVLVSFYTIFGYENQKQVNKVKLEKIDGSVYVYDSVFLRFNKNKFSLSFTRLYFLIYKYKLYLYFLSFQNENLDIHIFEFYLWYTLLTFFHLSKAVMTNLSCSSKKWIGSTPLKRLTL